MSDQTVQAALSGAATTIAIVVGIVINDRGLGNLRVHMDAQFDAIDKQFDKLLKHLEER